MNQPVTWKKSIKWNQKGITWNGMIQTERPNMALHVALGFAQLKDSDLANFADGVGGGLTGNTDCPIPPVTAVVLAGHVTAFRDDIGKALKGSVTDTETKNEARAVVVDDLRQDALYVEQKAGGVASKIEAAGYVTVTHGQPPRRPAKPDIIKVINKASGQLLVRVATMDNVYSVEVQTKYGAGDWQTVLNTSRMHGILLTGPTPGTTYNIACGPSARAARPASGATR